MSVVFADERLQKAYYKVRDENPMLYKFLDRATDDLKVNPECGIEVPKRLIPKVYIQKYGINNLWKYNYINIAFNIRQELHSMRWLIITLRPFFLWFHGEGVQSQKIS